MTAILEAMNPAAVQSAIRRKGTKFATVSFIKKDGSVRKINGLFRATSKMAGGAGGAMQHDVLKAHDLVPIYSLKDGGWRSFKVDSVLEVR